MPYTDSRDLPLVQSGWGLKTPFGIILPPGGRIAAYVRSTGAQDGDDITIGNNLVTTLASGLARCRSNMHDTVVVLPGHAEAVTTLDLTNLVATTRVVGIGTGTTMPKFTFGATSSQWAISKANCVFYGIKMDFTANGVVKGIYVTGSDCRFEGCTFIVASGAAAKATIVMELDTGADRFQLWNNKFYGTATHNVTDGVLVTAALTDCEFVGNRMIFSATAGKGNIHFVGASLNNYVAGNELYNTHTSSTACIALDDAASDGIMCRNMVATAVGTGTAPAAAGIVLAGTNTLWRFFENYSTPTKNTSALVVPVVDS